MFRHSPGIFQKTARHGIMTADNLTEDLAERLGQLLLTRNLLLVTAESCTGGGLAEIITRIPGSSNWFERGFVTYSNAAKREILGVDSGLIEQYGAVSEETAMAMAEGALAHSHAQISVAITGIAGPEGGTRDKPVGTVCFTWQFAGAGAKSTRVVFQGNRLQVRHQACLMAMQGLIDLLESQR
jgi:nicotinamide-nucleotide amidase